ncbi:sulfite exporter TauE/SafE family protein [Gramella sp. BOM4]|nr:sulfite exporter TauE/SafE family protein [Christiangramia bathymodioli]
MWISAFILGLLGSFHCVGMCGPIAFLLPVDRESRARRLFQIFLYHLGRLFSYSIIGIAFGLVGKSLLLFGFQQYLSIFVGGLMLLAVLFPALNIESNRFGRSWFRLIGKLKSSLGKELKKKRPDTFFSVGFLNGFLPCGLVYMAVFAAIAAGNALEGSFYMLLFGLGTIPLMTSAIWIGNFISGRIRARIRRFIPVAVGIIACLFILRGLGLGIPYVSPSKSKTEISATMECH